MVNHGEGGATLAFQPQADDEHGGTNLWGFGSMQGLASNAHTFQKQCNQTSVHALASMEPWLAKQVFVRTVHRSVFTTQLKIAETHRAQTETGFSSQTHPKYGWVEGRFLPLIALPELIQKLSNCSGCDHQSLFFEWQSRSCSEHRRQAITIQ